MIRELRTFLAVARDGTFTGAGRQLGLTQSAVSAQMRRLEDQLGVALFERTGKSAVLNTHGREMIPQAEEMLALAERMASDAGAARVSGLLRIGAIASVQQDLLVRALAAFRAHYPEVRVRLVPGVSLNLLGQVDAGEVDLAVLIRPPFTLPPELGWRSLLREPVVLAVPEDCRAAGWRELLTQEPFIRYDRGSFGGRQVDMFLRRHRLAVRDAIELDEIDAIGHLVRAGLGVALLPRTRQLDPRGLRLLPLGDAAFDREIGVVGRQPFERSPLTAKLVACLEAAADA